MNKHSMKEMLSRRSGMLKRLSLTILAVYCLFVVNTSMADFSASRNRRLSMGDMNCSLEPTQPVDPSDKPVFISSFPGSGSRMTWQIVEGLTGKPTGDEWNSNGLGKNVIGVKTHWPHPTHGNRVEWSEEVDRAIIFLRNPLHVLPAFHNYIYAATVTSTLEEGEDVDKVAPEISWFKWRDSNFNQQLYLWRVNVQYWLDKYTHENRVVTPYERLVDDIDGPKFAQELNLFLGRTGQQSSVIEEGLTTPQNGLVSDPDKVNCIWAKALDGEDSKLEQYIPRVDRYASASASAPERTLLRSSTTTPANSNSVERPYTKEQYNQLIVTIRNLRVKYGQDPRLDNTLKLYDEAIKRARDAVTYNNLFIH